MPIERPGSLFGHKRPLVQGEIPSVPEFAWKGADEGMVPKAVPRFLWFQQIGSFDEVRGSLGHGTSRDTVGDHPRLQSAPMG